MARPSVTSYRDQDFSRLKKDALKRNELFVDKEFPANTKSLYFSKVDTAIQWKRPSELCDKPRMVVDGMSASDLNEGQLGNAWFVSACCALLNDSKAFTKVIPNIREQDFTPTAQYAGIFHFQFWRYGRWVDVVVDDQLPCKDGALVFCHSRSTNEFWSALLEKAYAKLYGDYESLGQGYTADALVDFTGGVSEKLLVSQMSLTAEDSRVKLFFELSTALENNSIITCHVACNKDQIGQAAQQGLLKGHGYIIVATKNLELNKTTMDKLSLTDKRIQLIKLRNPWNTKEWTGAWSDSAPEWSSITSKERDILGAKVQQDGDFWMTFDDLLKHFTNIDLCHVVNTSALSIGPKKRWFESQAYGEWTMSGNAATAQAGGNTANVLHNPQYVFDTGEVEDTVMISLEQNDDVRERGLGAELLQIGFQLLKVEDNRRYRVHEATEKIAASEYRTTRSLFLRVRVAKGRYVIVPSTVKPQQTGKFLLRVYTESSTNLKPLSGDCPTKGLCSKPFVMVTRVKVIKAVGLDKGQIKGLFDPLVQVKCEGETVKSMYCRETVDPVWNFCTVFHRRDPKQPIVIEIWHHNRVLQDEFHSTSSISDPGTETPSLLKLELFGKKKKDSDVQLPGQMHVEITSDTDIRAL